VNLLGNARVRVPERARRGEIIEIRAMIEHPMESGFRLDNVGKPIARHIVDRFTCRYDGRDVFRVKLHPAVSTNPYFVFHAVATQTGALVFTWIDDEGNVATHTAQLEVIG
jgi:sulfur-oxidizing protein SoxZ